ncbi:hypothetical protein F1C10_14650 [Sphingomonas sp. NBWT7]|uniref:hypothetical protein n=1 Tax=Sphingomonas sp. NBWT7 TaxID=2596913 RepID=UPI001624AE7B|nr:hypothetical protein [Sphingomonas sp. NBWT7]QNE33034.1 hypothetical protein F1C10_14650 [Sphingomonas sp. NBWT7]
MQQELFRSPNLVVRRVGSRGGTLIITFGSLTDDPSPDRAGFGEDFLRRARIDAVHVINRSNRWYQYPDMADALAHVAATARLYDRAITYGSSMGGYAALRFAAGCGADTAVALSPQISVDPRVVPWERRWQPDVARTRFAEAPLVPAARQYVFYDPRVAGDARHASSIAAAGATTLVPVVGGGHPVGALLVETGALQAALRQIIAGTFDPAAMLRQVRHARRASQHHHFVLAKRCAARHPERSIRLLARATAIEPESHILSLQATLLDRLGRADDAAPLHRAAIRRTPSNAHAWMGYAAHLEAVGDPTTAGRALRSAAAHPHGATLLDVRLAQVRLWLRRHHLRWLDRAADRIVGRIRRSTHAPRLGRYLARLLR